MRIELMIIDPQNDFCHKNGALFVQGATEDMERLAAFIDRVGSKLYDIHVTLDTHHYMDIAHPGMWTDSSGNAPAPFTIISKKDVENGIWSARNPQFQARQLDYVRHLEDNGRYPLCIWPPHCLIGSWGYCVFEPLFKKLLDWEKKNFSFIDYVTKGSNLWTEHYSAVMADVADPKDPSTQLNTNFIQTLQEADIILLAGEARSHCLANTVRDIADNFGANEEEKTKNIKKMVLLQDATSDVPDLPGSTMFKDMGEQFVSDMMAKGMQVSTTIDFLK